jgi:hypothetical protein
MVVRKMRISAYLERNQGARSRIVGLVFTGIVLLASAAHAQQSAGWTETVGSFVSGDLFQGASGVHGIVGARKYFNSFTSYQFPNPFLPETDPLSRLEFPLDHWFIGGKAGYNSSVWSLDGQAWINVTRDSKLKMQDSDWEDESLPGQKTIFSESRCRLNRGFLLDLAIGFALPMDGWFNLSSARAVMGYRYEFFFFTTHDGRQMVLDGYTSDLNGDGIDFKQTFHNYYLGLNLRTTVNLAEIVSSLPQVSIEAQIDYGIVRGMNEDFHLLREGDRVTTERTRGHCWHALASLELAAPGEVQVVVEANFKRSLTHGSHRLNVFDLDFSFSGAKVWSDLVSLSFEGKKAF